MIVLAVFVVIAIFLQIFNDNTGPVETAYEIITFCVAAVALTLAIVQGIANARTTNELRRIIRELSKVVKTEEINLEYNVKLVKDLEKDLRISRENAAILKSKHKK